MRLIAAQFLYQALSHTHWHQTSGPISPFWLPLPYSPRGCGRDPRHDLSNPMPVGTTEEKGREFNEDQGNCIDHVFLIPETLWILITTRHHSKHAINTERRIRSLDWSACVNRGSTGGSGPKYVLLTVPIRYLQGRSAITLSFAAQRSRSRLQGTRP